jgi:ABC-2 type transport system permease protein
VLVAAAISFLFTFFASSNDFITTIPFGPAGENTDGPPLGILNAGTLTFASIFLGVVAAQAIGQEYRHGIIRLTLTQFPQRNRVMLGKLLVIVVFLALTAVVVLLGFYLGGLLGAVLQGKSVTFDPGSDIPLSVRAVLFVVLYGLFGFALTAITRNLPIGVVIPIVLALLAVTLIILIAGLANWTWVADVLPFANGQAAILTSGEVWRHLGVFGLWSLGLLAIGWVLFDRRDA